MADNDDTTVGDLTKVKQLTSSIRFESEAVRGQVEQMLTRYQDVADILGKTRELTKQEASFVKDYLSTVSQLSKPLGDQVKGLNEASRALIAMEQAVNRYTAAATKAEAVSGRLADSVKGARKEHSFRESQVQGAEQGVAEAQGNQSRYGDLRAALRLKGPEAQEKLTAMLGPGAEGKSLKGLRQMGGEQLSQQRTAIAAASGSGTSEDEVVGALKAEVELRQKVLDAAKKEEEISAKKLKDLQDQRKLAEQIKNKNDDAAKSTKAGLDAHAKLLPKLAKRFKDTEAAETAAEEPEEGGGGGKRRQAQFGRRGLMGNLGLNVLSDVGIPGVSQLAQVERYRRLAVDGADRFRANRAEAEGGEEGGGMLGAAAGLMANPIGLAVGGLAAVGGFGVHKFRQAMGEAESLAGPQRVLQGQVGMGRLGAANAAYRQDLTPYGLDIRESQSALIGLNRQVGGRYGGSQLRGAAALGQAFGENVGEVGGQAGALIRAGGASPAQAVKSLEKIMMEGVKAGMDRSRITEFTSEVVSIQEQLLRETGQNNAGAIAKSLAQFMGASGKQGSEFMQSAGFQGLMGINHAMQGFAKGGSGPGMGTLYRAFAPTVGGNTPSDRFVALNEKMEGGLFGGKGEGDNAAARAKQVMGQYFRESGAGDLFDRKTKGEKLTGKDQRRYQSAENVVRTRMQQEMGVGYGQSKELLKIMQNIDEKMATPEGQKELENVMKDMSDKTKDPLVALGDKMAQANTSLQEIAVSAGAIKGFIGAKQVEIGVNHLAKPLVEAGGDLFGKSVNMFGDGVKSFQDSVMFLGKIFGKDEATPEQKKQMDDSLRQMTGKGLDEFKDQGGMLDAIKTIVQGVFGFGGGQAAPPAGSAAAPQTSPTGVPMTPEVLSALMAKGGDQQAMLDALRTISTAVKENTAVTAHGTQVLKGASRSGNIGGSAGRN